VTNHIKGNNTVPLISPGSHPSTPSKVVGEALLDGDELVGVYVTDPTMLKLFQHMAGIWPGGNQLVLKRASRSQHEVLHRISRVFIQDAKDEVEKMPGMFGVRLSLVSFEWDDLGWKGLFRTYGLNPERTYEVTHTEATNTRRVRTVG